MTQNHTDTDPDPAAAPTTPATRAPGEALTGTRAAPHGSRVALFLLPAAVCVTGVLLALRLHFQPPTVPPYVVASPAAAAPETNARPLRSDDRFEAVLRPEGAVAGAVAARAFLIQGDEVRPIDLPFVISLDGSAQVGGAVGALFAGVPEGHWVLAVAVGRPEVLPTAPRDILRARTSPAEATAAWRLVVIPLWLGK